MPRSSNSAPVKVDKYNQNQATIHPITWAAIGGFFVVILALLLIFSPNNQERIYNAYTAYGVTELPKDHPLYQVDYEGGLFKKGLEDIIEKDEVVVLLIGFAACPGCQSHVAPLSKYFESTGMNEYVDRIYYLDTTKDLNGFEKLAATYPEIVETTPQIILFINGELVKLYTPDQADTSTETAINRNMRDFFEDSIDLINA